MLLSWRISMRPQLESSPQEVLAGLVERVTFHNAENGFCVLRAKARGHRDLVTVVGHAATIAAGEWITASGDWVNDRTHGQQFKARFLRTSAPIFRELFDRLHQPCKELIMRLKRGKRLTRPRTPSPGLASAPRMGGHRERAAGGAVQGRRYGGLRMNMIARTAMLAAARSPDHDSSSMSPGGTMPAGVIRAGPTGPNILR
jgi:hypothetical protein